MMRGIGGYVIVAVMPTTISLNIGGIAQTSFVYRAKPLWQMTRLTIPLPVVAMPTMSKRIGKNVTPAVKYCQDRCPINHIARPLMSVIVARHIPALMFGIVEIPIMNL